MILLTTKEPIEYLRALLKHRQSLNRRYSLRSMAKSLGISAPSFWNALNGKRRISHTRLMEMSSHLRVNSHERKHFLLLIELQESVNEQQIKSVLGKIERNRARAETLLIKGDDIPNLLKWNSFLVIEAFNISGDALSSTLNLTRLSEITGLKKSVITPILRNLKKAKIVEERERGRFSKVVGSVIGQSKCDDLSYKGIHKEGLLHALKSVDTVPASLRYSVTEMISVNPALIDKIKDIINESLDQTHLVQSGSPLDRKTFAISFHLFPAIGAQV